MDNRDLIGWHVNLYKESGLSVTGSCGIFGHYGTTPGSDRNVDGALINRSWKTEESAAGVVEIEPCGETVAASLVNLKHCQHNQES